MTKIITKGNIEEVIHVIENDGIVAFPTETVYGLGVRFGSRVALDRLMEAKQRDYSKAVTLMLADKKEISQYAYVNDKAKKLIDKFMPGMITLVFKKKDDVDSYMTNGKETIGVRIPDSEYVLNLIKKTGPLFVTSANLSSHQNTTTTNEVLMQLEGRIDLIVDGKTSDNIASTVVDVSEDEIKILRVGKISEEDIKEAIK